MPIYVPRRFSTNPRQTFCPICRGPTDEVLMMGDTHKFICIHCSMLHLGQPDDRLCVQCQCNKLRDTGESLPDERFAASRACDACQEAIVQARAVIALGGLGFRCSDCGSIGAFAKENPMVAEFRSRFPDKRTNVWQLDRLNCPECRKKHEQAQLQQPVETSGTGPG